MLEYEQPIAPFVVLSVLVPSCREFFATKSQSHDTQSFPK